MVLGKKVAIFDWEGVVAQWLGVCLWCYRSHVRFPLAARKISVSEHAFSSVICRDDAR